MLYCSVVTPGWIRVGGVLACTFGIYYLGAAEADRKHGQSHAGFYWSTILGRVLLAAAFALLVVTQQVASMLLVPAVVNLLGAANMWLALRNQAARP